MKSTVFKRALLRRWAVSAWFGLAGWFGFFGLVGFSGHANAQVQDIPPAMSVPVRVGVSIFLLDVTRINDAAGTWEGQIDLRFRWKDPSQAFSPKVAGGDRIEVRQEELAARLKTQWTPRLVVANQVGNPQKIDGGLFIYADGTVEQIQRIRGVFESRYHLAAFPFDREPLAVRVLSQRYPMSQLELVQEQRDINLSGIRETLSLSGWEVKRAEFVPPQRQRGWNGDTYSELVNQFWMERLPGSYLVAILTPFLLTLLIPTLVTLYVKADVAPRMTLWAGSILALIALNFTFSVRYPALPFNSIVSQLINIGFVYQLTMTAITGVLLNPPVADRFMSKVLQDELAKFLRLGLPLAFLGLVSTRAALTAMSLV